MRRAWLLWAVSLAGCTWRPAVSIDAGVPFVDAGTQVDVAAGDDLPRAGTYAGSDACRDCHVERSEAWEHDWHRRALSEPTPATVVGRYNGAHFKGQSSEATMFARDGGYFMKTADGSGVSQDFAVNYVVGGKRMQDALTEFSDGRWQVLPVYFHVTGKGEWVDYNEAKQGAVGPQHPFFWANFRRTANHECIACHATGWSVSYSRATHRWSTSAEPGVGCEACHGPGARHAESKLAADIFSFSKATKEQGLAVCASCHGPREPHRPFLDASARFVPGQAYDDFFQPSGLVDGERRSGEYFADGRPSSSSFEWQALQQSKCFREGGVTCATCHGGPHGGTFANELTKQGQPSLERAADASCLSCHAAKAGPGHTHHQTAAGQSCVGCHMPKTVTGVLDHFADHSIDVPVPENSVEHGVPNGCAPCHAKLSAEALAKQVKAWWPNSTRRERRVRLAAAFDEKTKAASEAALVQVVTDEREAPLLRGFAAELLGQRFAAKASEVLPQVLDAGDAYLRSRVLAGLSSARAKGAANEVAKRLTDSSLVVRQFAALLLVNWGDGRGQAALEQLASSPATRTLARPHLVLAQRFASMGQFERARKELARVLEVMPYSASALVLQADFAVQAKDPGLAQAALEEALRFDPSNEAARQRLRVIAP